MGSDSSRVIVVPLPGSLSSRIAPPISCASCREMTSPSPVPPGRRRAVVAFRLA